MNARPYCYRGHPMTGDNLAYRPNGYRYCRECNRTRAREALTQVTSCADLAREATQLATTHRLGSWERDSPHSLVTSCEVCGGLAAVDARAREINGEAIRRPCAA